MQPYNQSTHEICSQPLDFTSNCKSTILDLSCKKDKEYQHDYTNSCNLDQVPSEIQSIEMTHRTNTSTTDLRLSYQSQQISCGDESESSFEVRTCMVTPPSESDSPKKPKFYSIYPSLSESEISSRYSALPMGNSTLPISSILSNVLTGDNSSQLQIPTTLSTLIPTSPSHSIVSVPMTSPEASKKAPRPFKAYPKNPLSMSMVPPEFIHDPRSNEAYNEFRKQMLESVRKTNKGTNIKMRRTSKSPTLPTSTMDDKDSAYWERRRKNNEAAKRSRDARRAKEDEIAIRAAFLERENMQLKCEVLALRNKTAKLQRLLYSN